MFCLGLLFVTVSEEQRKSQRNPWFFTNLKADWNGRQMWDNIYSSRASVFEPKSVVWGCKNSLRNPASSSNNFSFDNWLLVRASMDHVRSTLYLSVVKAWFFKRNLHFSNRTIFSFVHSGKIQTFCETRKMSMWNCSLPNSQETG